MVDRRRPVVGVLIAIASVFTGVWFPRIVSAGEPPTMPRGDGWTNHPAVEPFDVDARALPSELYLVRARGELPPVDGVTVHAHRGDRFLVSGPLDRMRILASHGGKVVPLSPRAVQAPSVSAVTRLEESPRTWALEEPDPVVADIVSRVDWTAMEGKITHLVDYGTRFSYAPNHKQVATWLADEFASYGVDVEMQPFIYKGRKIWNVVATKEGAVSPDSYVIICGHFDSISDRAIIAAPGADDNASGTAAVLLAAELFSEYEFEHSIRFICFGGEEQILQGSDVYARRAYETGMDIVGTMNFDMIGWWKPGVRRDLEIETNNASKWMATIIVGAAQMYTETPIRLHVFDGAWWGDHASFWKYGFPAVNHEESWDWNDPDFNPRYHTMNDNVEFLHRGFTVDNAKVALAALATLAVPRRVVEVTLDLKPGSANNPFNPKSNGVTDAVIFGGADMDVNELDMSTLRLAGAPVMKTRIEDVGAPAGVNAGSGEPQKADGYPDVWIKVSSRSLAGALDGAAKEDVLDVTVTGSLYDGTSIRGTDTVWIVGNQRGPVTATGDDTEAAGGRADASPPPTFALHANVPNPFRGSTAIRFDVPEGGADVTLRIYDSRGRLVRTLIDGAVGGGERTHLWNGLNDAGDLVAVGIYFYRLDAPGYARTRKMVLLR